MGTASWICRGSVLVSGRDRRIGGKRTLKELPVGLECVVLHLSEAAGRRSGLTNSQSMQTFRESAEKTLEQKACRDGENSAETQEKGSASGFSGFSVTV